MKFSTGKPHSVGKAMRDVNTGMSKGLSIADQFNGFTYTVTINAGDTATIPNQLRDGQGNRIIPREWSVIDAAGATTGSIVRGATDWTPTHLYLKNTSHQNGQFKIRFLERPKSSTSDTPLVAPATTTVPEIRVDTGNGHGSAGNKVRIFTTIAVDNGGDAITYSTTSANGGQMLVNEAGLYTTGFTDLHSAGGITVGITVNASSLTTSPFSLSYANGKRAVNYIISSGVPVGVTWTGVLAAGDIVRAMTNGIADGATENVFWYIVQLLRF